MKEIINQAMDCMGVAVSIIDASGALLYYNRAAARILDRQPEYIGNDVRTHHRKAASNAKLETMLKEFRNGRTDPFHYRAIPYGKPLWVTLAPVIEQGEFLGCVQSVLLKSELEANFG